MPELGVSNAQLILAAKQTAYMVFVSLAAGTVLAMIMAFALVLTRSDSILPNRYDTLLQHCGAERRAGRSLRPRRPATGACSADFDPQLRQQPILTHPRDDGTEFLILILKLPIAGCFCLRLAPLCGGRASA